jgi:hypothetical protein
MLTRTEDGFTVEKKEICDAIYGDNSAFIVEMLEECGFVKEGTPPISLTTAICSHTSF